MAGQQTGKQEKNISFKIDPELHKDFRMLCFDRNTNIKRDLLMYIKERVAKYRESS